MRRLMVILFMLLSASIAGYAQGIIIAEVVYWPVVLGGGHVRTDIMVDVEDVSFGGECVGTEVDAATTLELFDAIAEAAIYQVLDSGAIAPLTACNWNNVRVHTASCVERNGSGCATYFTACDTAHAWRDYRVCLSGGDTTVTFVTASAPACGGSCASTGDAAYIN